MKAETLSTTGKKILIVEDEALVAKDIQLNLEARGYAVVGLATSGEAAVRQAQETQPDMVLMDIRLRGEMDGIQVAEAIRGCLDVPLVYLSAHFDDETLARARLTEPFGYLVKPFDPIELYSTLEIALYKHRMDRRLKESEARYRGLFEGVPMSLYRITPNGQCIDANPALVEMLGYPDRESLLEVNVADLYVDTKERRRIQLDLERDGLVRDCEAQLRRRDGTLIWARVNIRAVRDDGGQLAYYEGSLEDVTQRVQAEEELRRRASQLEVLRRVEMDITAELRLDTLLRSLVSRAVKLLQVGSGDFYLYRPERDVLERHTSVGAGQTAGITLKRGEGLAGAILESGQALAVDDYQHWPGRAAIFEGAPITAVLGAPVRWGPPAAGEEFLGVLIVRADRPCAFSQADIDLLSMFAAHAAIAIKNARLFEHAQQSAARLETLYRRLVEAQEAERRSVARELHDEVGQVLTAVKTNLQTIQVSPDPLTLTSRLAESISIVDHTLQHVRDLSLDLRPSLLDDFGLLAALEWYVERQAQRCGFEADLLVDPPGLRLSPTLESTCFRVVQAALTNVARHAQAKRVHVELRHCHAQGAELGEVELLLIVRDDGRGFDVPAAFERAASGDSLGLLSMRERVWLAGGQLDIDAAPGRGTEIRARFPAMALFSGRF